MFWFWWIGAAAIAVAPTPTATVTATDDHSWFSFAPSLLSLPADTPIKGTIKGELPGLTGRLTVTVTLPRASVPIPPAPDFTVTVPLERTPVYGSIRVTLPGVQAKFTGSIGDVDEPLLLMVAQLIPPPPRVHLVDRRIVEDEWLAILAGYLT